MNKILVTGAAGFIPSSLIDSLLKNRNNYIVGVDNLSTGNLSNLPQNNSNFKFINLNTNFYNDLATVMSIHKFDFVFHYAAAVGVTRTIQNPLLVLEDIKGIQNILEISKNTLVKRIFFSSSSEVYGEPVELPQNEITTPLNSKLPYAIVKNVGEAFLKSYYQSHSLPFTIFRFFNTYGAKQTNEFVISKFINSAINNLDITIYGDGMQTRTFCYIDDNINTTLICLYNDKFINDVLNIGHNEEITVIDLAKLIINLTNSKSKIIYLKPLAEGDMKRRCPDNNKMKSVLNKELTSLSKGIKLILDSIKRND